MREIAKGYFPELLNDRKRNAWSKIMNDIINGKKLNESQRAPLKRGRSPGNKTQLTEELQTKSKKFYKDGSVYKGRFQGGSIILT